MAIRLPFEEIAELTGGLNDLQPEDRAVHRWYNFVLSFPPHLVRQYLDRFGLGPGHTILDPFCGTGTTPVECKKLGIRGVGIEAIPMSHFADCVKTDWSPDPDRLVAHARAIADRAREAMVHDCAHWEPRTPDGLRTLPTEKLRLLIKDSISPLPLHKTLILIEAINSAYNAAVNGHELLALASVLPTEIGNLRFGPEVGVGQMRTDSAVVDVWLAEVEAMAEDLRIVNERRDTPTTVCCGDARRPMQLLKEHSIDAVITSPPYPNEKDYTRIVRLESVLLGFMDDRSDLRRTKQSLLRSNTRNVFKADEDDRLVDEHQSIQRIAQTIEERRLALGKTSGFERNYHRATLLYFGGMKRHFANLRAALRPGARLAYVVGDQASYLRVMIRTGRLLAEIAESVGYEVEDIDLFRTRMATVTREQLREEVLLLRWPG